jgi:hypothetical protein
MSIAVSLTSENVECSGMPSRLFVILLLLFSTNVARAQVKVPVQECSGLKKWNSEIPHSILSRSPG